MAGQMRRPPPTAWVSLLAVLFACGEPPGAGGTDSSGASTSTSGVTSDGASTGSTDPASATISSTSATRGTSTSTTRGPTLGTTDSDTSSSGVSTSSGTDSTATDSTATDSTATDSTATTDTDTTGDPLDDLLTLDHVQVKGTHNSYHLEPALPFDSSHEYSHKPLDVQLHDQGVRAFELDVHEGLGGFEVYHISVVDSKTTCDAFTDCLDVIKGWSDAHPQHLPIAVWVEVKDSTGGLPIDADDLDLLDDDIRSVFSEEQLLSPDDVQGEAQSLRAALEDTGWPTLGELRGQVYFILLNVDEKSEDYTYGFTTTEGRAMFARVAPDDFAAPWAAIAKLGLGDVAAIDAAHAAGILIATNVCGAGDEDAACAAELETAQQHGIHMLKDDFPAAVDGQAYFMDFEDGNPARCNPITAPPECTSIALEDL